MVNNDNDNGKSGSSRSLVPGKFLVESFRIYCVYRLFDARSPATSSYRRRMYFYMNRKDKRKEAEKGSERERERDRKKTKKKKKRKRPNTTRRSPTSRRHLDSGRKFFMRFALWLKRSRLTVHHPLSFYFSKSFENFGFGGKFKR